MTSNTYLKTSEEEATNLRVDNIIIQNSALLVSGSHQAGQQVTRMLVFAWNKSNNYYSLSAPLLL